MSLNRARVCAVGTEAQMIRLLTVLLDNCAGYEEPEDRPPWTLNELRTQMEQVCREEVPEGDTFLYEMISPSRYGSAVEGTCRLDLREHGCGLWMATFAYESEEPFQTHEWLDLHRRTDRILIVAQRASEDFGADKGEVIFSGGGMTDNWDNMVECWIWLMLQYGCGMPPEEAAERFRHLDRQMEEEEYDQTADEALASCAANLEAVAMSVSDSIQLSESMAEARERRDWNRLLAYQHMLAESALWETEHNAKWLACIETVRAEMQN